MVITDVNQVVYQGDGVTTAFPFTFRIIDATDIKLLLIDADGTETDITSDYFVDTNTNTVYYPGYAPGAEPGLADQPAPVQEGQRLVVYRELPVTQEKDLGEKWPFFVIELALDKLTMLIQGISGIWNRCLRVTVGQSATHPDFDYNIPIEAGKTFRVKDDGTGFELTEDPAVAHAAAVAAQEAAERAQGIAEEARDDAEAAAALTELQAVWFDNVAAMKAADIPVGMTAGTKAKSTKNDGMGGLYIIREKTTRDYFNNGLYLDDYINIELDNGLVAEKIVSESIPAVSNIHNSDGTVQKILEICNTYNAHIDEIQYYNSYTAWDRTTQQVDGKWSLDCSSFVSLLLHGVTFEKSRYNGNTENIVDDAFFNRIDSKIYRYANHIAEWCYKNGYTFLPNEDYSNLEPGDIIFQNYGAEGDFADNTFMHIGHVGMFISKINNERYLVAHYANGVVRFPATMTSGDMEKIVLVARLPFKEMQSNFENLIIHPNTEVIITNGNREPVYTLSKPLKAGKFYTICLRAQITNDETYPMFRTTANETIFSAWGANIFGRIVDYVYTFRCDEEFEGIKNLKIVIAKKSPESVSTRDAIIKDMYLYEGFSSSFRDGLPAYDFNYPIIGNITLTDNINNHITSGMAAKSFYVEHETYYEVSVILPLTITLTGRTQIGTMPTGIPLCRIPAIFSLDGMTPIFGALQVSNNGALETIIYNSNASSYKYIFATGIVAK